MSCGDCIECCKNGAEIGYADDTDALEFRFTADGCLAVAIDPDTRWCVYALPGVGCTRYDRRPQKCREFHCRDYAGRDDLVGIVRQDVLDMADKMARTGE